MVKLKIHIKGYIMLTRALQLTRLTRPNIRAMGTATTPNLNQRQGNASTHPYQKLKSSLYEVSQQGKQPDPLFWQAEREAHNRQPAIAPEAHAAREDFINNISQLDLFHCVFNIDQSQLKGFTPEQTQGVIDIVKDKAKTVPLDTISAALETFPRLDPQIKEVLQDVAFLKIKEYGTSNAQRNRADLLQLIYYNELANEDPILKKPLQDRYKEVMNTDMPRDELIDTLFNRFLKTPAIQGYTKQLLIDYFCTPSIKKLPDSQEDFQKLGQLIEQYQEEKYNESDPFLRRLQDRYNTLEKNIAAQEAEQEDLPKSRLGNAGSVLTEWMKAAKK